MDNNTRSQENKSKEEGHQEAKEIVTEVNSAQNFIDFTEAEEDLVFRMHRLVGNRWDLIAGRIPGRTAAEVEMFWSRKHQEK